MAYTKYSLTPSSNNAAPPDGAPEGMLPSAVNDTMRDMMAQIRDCGDGIRGGTYTMTAPVITGGSITGVALSGNTLTNPVITGGSINNTPIGATTANTGAFSTLAYSSTLTGGTGVVNLGSGQFYKDASGNVGIGTSSPQFTAANRTVLTLNGTTSSLLGLSYGNSSSTAAYLFYSGDLSITNATSGGTMNFLTQSLERMRIDSSGNLLVGTTSASYSVADRGLIEVNGSSESLIAFKIGGSTTNAVYQYNNTTNFETNVTGSRYMNWTVNGSERMRITSGGNILINATATTSYFQEQLNVAGSSSFKAVSGSAAVPIFCWNDATSGDNNFIQFGTEASFTTRGSIIYNRASGLTAYNVTSDYRAKDIISPVLDSGEMIDSVPVYMGKMKGATQARPMFIAHETPSYAHTGEKDAVDKDGKPVYQQMDASSLVPVLWAEVQSLRKRLSILESK